MTPAGYSAKAATHMPAAGIHVDACSSYILARQSSEGGAVADDSGAAHEMQCDAAATELQSCRACSPAANCSPESRARLCLRHQPQQQPLVLARATGPPARRVS
jgi:hypothetical protein